MQVTIHTQIRSVYKDVSEEEALRFHLEAVNSFESVVAEHSGDVNTQVRSVTLDDRKSYG